MARHFRIFVLLALLTGRCVQADPIRVAPTNPHYYFYEGKPILLITSAEHYGAVINKDFDYIPYLDALQAHGLNYTRFYPGAMFEPVGKFLAGNTLGPKPGSLVVPWARSETPGYRLGGNRFDLDRWDPAYFVRFKDFLAQAGRRGIIVELCFFNSQYEDTWPLSPLFAENNVQGAGRCDWRAAQTLKDSDLVARQDAYVRKLTQEANAFDNVILEICDEPGHIGTGFDLSGPWVAHLAGVVLETERGLPNKHLLGEEVDGPLGGPVDFAADPRFTVIVGQYIWGDDQGEMGGMKGLDFKYKDNKPIELNETGYFPLWYKGDKVADSRVEAWEFMVGGGAGFNHLNGLFTVENPAGRTPENERVLRALGNLKRFLEGFEFVRMAPDKDFLVSGVKAPQYHRAISEPGKQYALYIHHSSEKVGGSYTVVPGDYREELLVKLPHGRYRAEWVDPETGSILGSEDLNHEGGNRTLKTPPYTVDIALSIKRAYLPFDGEKSAWHEGFDRYDFVMDEETLAIQPFKAPEGEKFGVRDPQKGQRRCLVIVPKQAAAGQPWSWRGCYWDHQPQTEIELLRRGFHVAYISANATLKPGKEWNAWYAFLTDTHGLSRKPAFIGMSRGGEYAYTWAAAHPDQVACIYADNPGANRDLLMRIGGLASNDVPLLHVCGSIDPLLGKYSTAIEGIYQQLGGRISVMIKDGAGHHPHSLRDPRPIADFIVQSVQPRHSDPPDYLSGRITKTSYYSLENSYRDYPSEGTSITCRGPQFTECYDRYSFDLSGVEGAITVIVPQAAAPGNPWVFRAEFVPRDASVDLALLARGFHIVTGPVPYNSDGPIMAHWSAVYKNLTDHGFSRKPVMEGAGRSAGDAYAWAIENPDKVSCVYAENPVLRSAMSKGQPLDNLAPLAKAGVPLLHVCGSLDPALNDQTRIVEKRYRELGGQITVIVKEGEGHYPLGPKDPKLVVDFIVGKTQGMAPSPQR